MDMKNKFIKFVKEEYGMDITTQPSKTPDTFENIFGTSFKDGINMKKIKVEHLLYYVGGYTKVIIGDCTDNEFTELWRGKVDDLDWNNIPCGDRYIECITVVEGEDWLQIWV